jgi:uncharacterized BrkB/YihY/UPF0761 family membrane protein
METENDAAGAAPDAALPAGDDAPPSTSPAPPSRLRRLRDWAQGTAEDLYSRADASRRRVPVIDLGFTLAGRFRFLQVSLISGYLAMRFFILLFPLAYVVIAGFGLTTSRDDVVDAGEDLGLSGAVADSIADAAAASDRGHWIALIVGLMATAWAGRGTLRALRIAHAEAWRLNVPKTSYASPGGLGVAACLLASIMFGSWITSLREDGYSLVLLFIFQGLVVGAVWLAVAVLMPRPEGTRWTDVVPGAALVGLAAPALNLAVAVYFGPRVARTQATYGAIGVGVVILAYLLVISWLIVLSAELNSGVHAWRSARRQPAPTD